MEKFSLEEYLRNPSRKLCTRGGNNVRIICTNQQSTTPIVALVMFCGTELVYSYEEDGQLCDVECDDDLMFKYSLKERWINIFRCESGYVISRPYEALDEALQDANKFPDTYITTKRITWEENYDNRFEQILK